MPELPEITKLYIAQVLLTAYESQQSLSIIPITNTLSTQTTLLTGSYFVCLKERENEIQALVDAHNQLDDEILQSLLDYPGSLPKGIQII